MENQQNNVKLDGRICQVQRDSYTIICEKGEIRAKVKGTFYKNNMDFPVVGDRVSIKYNPYGDSVIVEVYERKSVFTRPDLSGHVEGYVKTVKEQVLAANFDYVFIVASLNKNFSINRITRYITVTLQGGGKPVVILTKADQCEDTSYYMDQVKRVSGQVHVHAVSALTGDGMEQLITYLEDGTVIALLGSSGVGKSTLVNALAGRDIMKVSAIREGDSKGRHTTTHRQMIILPSGTAVIDTPGIRELGMCDVNEGIEDTFSDITSLLSQCRFRNCTHKSEPGCRIKAALENQDLTLEKWDLYCRLRKESSWGAEKSARVKNQGKRMKRTKQ